MLQGEHIMGWRTIIIEQSQQVSLYLDNLKIRMLEGAVLLQPLGIILQFVMGRVII